MPPSPSPVSSMSLSATTSRGMPPPVLPSRRASVVASASSASSSGEDVEKEAKKAAKEAKKLAKEAKKAQKVRREKEEIEKTLTLGWLLSPKLFAADSLSHLETPKTAHTHAPPSPPQIAEGPCRSLNGRRTSLQRAGRRKKRRRRR